RLSGQAGDLIARGLPRQCRRFEVPTTPAASSFRNFKSKSGTRIVCLLVPLASEVRVRGAAMDDELRKRGTRRDAFLRKIGTRPLVMGILNLTPDSFSDGGRFAAPQAAIAHAEALVAQGCDILDLGGESTRPGARPVSEAEELARVTPVLSELAGTLAA